MSDEQLIHVKLPRRLHERLKADAEALGTPISWVVRQAIRHWLNWRRVPFHKPEMAYDCPVCGEPVRDAQPLHEECLAEQMEREEDYRAEKEQARRPF